MEQSCRAGIDTATVTRGMCGRSCCMRPQGQAQPHEHASAEYSAPLATRRAGFGAFSLRWDECVGTSHACACPHTCDDPQDVGGASSTVVHADGLFTSEWCILAASSDLLLIRSGRALSTALQLCACYCLVPTVFICSTVVSGGPELRAGIHARFPPSHREGRTQASCPPEDPEDSGCLNNVFSYLATSSQVRDR